MKDLISKAGVLETYAELYDTFEDNQFIRKELNKVYDKLNGLSYAQPEPCEDAVSRKAVEEMLKNGFPARGMWEIEGDVVKQTVCETLADALMDLGELPSVTPKCVSKMTERRTDGNSRD